MAAADQPMIGEAAPNFKLRSLSGNSVDLEDFRGKTLGESKVDARKYAERSKFTFPVLLDADGAVAASLRPPAYSRSFRETRRRIASNLAIDSKGRIVFYSLLDSVHFDAKLVALKARLEQLLANP